MKSKCKKKTTDKSIICIFALTTTSIKYRHWLLSHLKFVCCLSVNDAVKVRMEGGVMEECEASADVLLSDTMDQYRTFQMCERLLYSPAKLGNQLLFQIPPHLQATLIER